MGDQPGPGRGRRSREQQSSAGRMAEDLASPRINAQYLSAFQNQTVRIVGRVTQLRGEQATIDAAGSVTVFLNRVSWGRTRPRSRHLCLESTTSACAGTVLHFSVALERERVSWDSFESTRHTCEPFRQSIHCVYFHQTDTHVLRSTTYQGTSSTNTTVHVGLPSHAPQRRRDCRQGQPGPERQGAGGDGLRG